MMKIKIYSYGCALPFINDRELIELDIKEKITIAEVLQDLGALEDKALDGVLFFANDKRVKMNYSLKDNDVIKMCPIIGGG